MKLSVCLLTYNHGHVLAQTVEAILSQSFSDFELIISDDCSNDNSWQVINALAATDERISAIQTPHNLGMAGNANFAIRRAKGVYVALLHHDDIVDARLFEDWLAVVGECSSVGFVFNDYLLFNGVIAHRLEKRSFSRCMAGRRFLLDTLLKSLSCPVRGTALIKRSAFFEVGGMNDRFGLLADVDLWMRLAAHCDVGYVNQPLIKVLLLQKDNYPPEYTRFSWARLAILFEIHAENLRRLESSISRLDFKLRWLRFRVAVTRERIKWLVYALVKRRAEMITSASEHPNNYEFAAARVVLRIAHFIAKWRH